MAADTILMNQTIRDGQTIVSPQQTFELGFFSPGNTSNRYVAIWFKRKATGTIVWVANRETPIRTKSGLLTLDHNGVLEIHDSATNVTIWSSTSSRTTRKINPVAKLFDSGNLMVMDREEGPENYIWQSFDSPGDTALPGSRFGRNLERGVVTNYTSWKSVDDPSKGMFMMYMDFNGLPQVFQNNGDVIQSRLGSWNGVRYTGNKGNEIYMDAYVSNEKETYTMMRLNLANSSVVSMMRLDHDGIMGRYIWINQTQGWSLRIYTKGYGSVALDCWVKRLSKGSGIGCGVREGFRKYSFMKLPDTRHSWFDVNMSLTQCKVKCKNECNCTAYATLDIKQGVGCLLWYDELIDMRTLPNGGQDIYIRIANLELDKTGSRSKSKLMKTVLILALLAFITIPLGIRFLIIRKRRLVKPQDMHAPKDLPLFSLSTLVAATNNFSDSNKLGQGGFGPVYKGCFKDGQEIAVKRLSASSSQGPEEFKNEVIFISRLQHRNLVKILGYCFEDGLKLEWLKKFHIIEGIARGLLYLHQDSRLRIIHRDLKAANSLLDHDMNPKISDFGLAKSFGENETQTNTKKVVGT
ncbi:hypothetical protein QVD17_05435 [Tagetes erecta]|uniref:non-specific serine/threonine protein kinase n=1 Tax=Tagetes erecta TaxID=13708 RepID=A0AAD8LLH5_TARER|nr:hypothetical protein QVD17_05435 [Tagetes erecta]